MNLLVCCFCPAFAKAIKSVSSEVLAVGAHMCPTMGSPEVLAVGAHMSHTMDSSSEQHVIGFPVSCNSHDGSEHRQYDQ